MKEIRDIKRLEAYFEEQRPHFVAEGVPQKLEHNDIRWITPEEIPEYDFCPRP